MRIAVPILGVVLGISLAACQTPPTGSEMPEAPITDAEAGQSAALGAGTVERAPTTTPPSADAVIRPPSESGVPVGHPLSQVTPIVPIGCPRGALIEVLVQMDITPRGEARNADIVYSDDPCYDEAALEAVEAVRYQPLFNGDRAEKMTGVMSAIVFDTRYSARDSFDEQ